MTGWLSPENLPADTICREIFIPNNIDIIAAVNGALFELTLDENWQEFGAILPAEIAERMLQTWVEFMESTGACTPVGTIVLFGGDTAPNEHWLLCDGTAVNVADYPKLFDVIGMNYGSPAPFKKFYLPDYRGRVGVGAGQGAGLSNYDVGDKAGSEQRALGTGNHAPHTHSVHAHLTGLALAPGELVVSVPNVLPGNTGSQGSGTPFDIRQPTLASNCIIRAK